MNADGFFDKHSRTSVTTSFHPLEFNPQPKTTAGLTGRRVQGPWDAAHSFLPPPFDSTHPLQKKLHPHGFTPTASRHHPGFWMRTNSNNGRTQQKKHRPERTTRVDPGARTTGDRLDLRRLESRRIWKV